MSIQDVRDFLLEFKQVATGGSGVDIVPRAETRPTLAQLGLTMANLEEFLLGLSVAGLLQRTGARSRQARQHLDLRARDRRPRGLY